MFGVDLLVLSSLTVLAAHQAPQVQCEMPEAPLINIKPKTEKILYDFTRPAAELSEHEIDTISPYASETRTLVGGLHEGPIEIKTSATVGGTVWETLGLGCLYYKSVDVEISLAPVVYVAREYEQGTCRHDVILEHELGHVAIDRQVVNEFSHIIGKAVQQAVNEAGLQGPFRLEDIDTRRAEMMEYISNVVNAKWMLMKNDVQRRQQAHDSYEEYERVQNACK